MDLFERRQTLRDPTQMPPPTKVLVPLGPPSTIIVISLLFGFLKIKIKKSVISLANHSSRQLDVNEDATLPEDIPSSGLSPF